MMARWKRIWQKIKEGKLRQVLSELSWIYGYGRRYRAAVAWYIFLGVLGTGMSLAASVLSKNIVDVVTGFDTGALAPAAVFYVLMQLARNWGQRLDRTHFCRSRGEGGPGDSGGGL